MHEVVSGDCLRRFVCSVRNRSTTLCVFFVRIYLFSQNVVKLPSHTHHLLQLTDFLFVI